MQKIMNPFDHEYWMKKAYAEAEKALKTDEVPVGAIIVKDNIIIARGYNQVETLKDPTAHAEMIAITAACDTLGEKRLDGCTIYVTLEPCPMCAGAIVLARIPRLIYGVADPQAGACGSVYDICRDGCLNHKVEIVSGVMEHECSRILQDFFESIRCRNKNQSFDR